VEGPPIRLPKTTPDQRLALYEDVEALISPGFLSHTVTINYALLSLRSLGPGDVHLLKARVATGFDDDWKVWVIASSIWMVDGYCLLDEPHAAPRMAKMVRALPRHIRNILFSLVTGLFSRSSKAVDATEPYCYEGVSRFRWKSFGGHVPGLHAGIPGVERLGSNHVQRMWTFYNEVEDKRVEEETLWEGFKLTASAQAPKGVKKIDARDQQHRQQELTRRQTLLDRFYYTRKGLLLDLPDAMDSQKAIVDSGSKTADELADEMHRWVSGQEDWHDKIVTEYKRRVSEKYEAEKQERARRADALRSQMTGDQGLAPTTALVGYSAVQLQAMLRERHPGHPGVKQVSAGVNSARDYLYEKYLRREADAGVLRSVDGHLVPTEGRELTNEVAQRLVPFQSGPGDGEERS